MDGVPELIVTPPPKTTPKFDNTVVTPFAKIQLAAVKRFEASQKQDKTGKDSCCMIKQRCVTMFL